MTYDIAHITAHQIRHKSNTRLIAVKDTAPIWHLVVNIVWSPLLHTHHCQTHCLLFDMCQSVISNTRPGAAACKEAAQTTAPNMLRTNWAPPRSVCCMLLLRTNYEQPEERTRSRRKENKHKICHMSYVLCAMCYVLCAMCYVPPEEMRRSTRDVAAEQHKSCASLLFHITLPTANAPTPKSTKSKDSNPSVQIQIKSKISFWICTTRRWGIWVFRFGGFRGRSILSGNCDMCQSVWQWWRTHSWALMQRRDVQDDTAATPILVQCTMYTM